MKQSNHANQKSENQGHTQMKPASSKPRKKGGFLNTLTQCLIIMLIFQMSIGKAYAQRTTTFFHNDGQGSVVAASDENGNLLWRKSYMPYGAQTGDTSEPLSYTGKPHDESTGLTYFGARYYDPELRRFISTDPVGFTESNPMSFNRYAYANNNPYKYVDPDGRVALPVVLLFVACVAVTIGVISTPLPAHSPGSASTYRPDSDGIGGVFGTESPASASSGAWHTGDTNREDIARLLGINVYSDSSDITRGADITSDTIKQALKDDPNKASQKAVGLKLVQQYYDDLDNTSAPSIKMDGDVITDGHHRYIAGKIKGLMPGIDPGPLTNAKKANVRPISEIETY